MAMDKDAKLIDEGKIVRDNLGMIKEQYTEDTWNSRLCDDLNQMVDSIWEVDAKVAKSRKHQGRAQAHLRVLTLPTRMWMHLAEQMKRVVEYLERRHQVRRGFAKNLKQFEFCSNTGWFG